MAVSVLLEPDEFRLQNSRVHHPGLPDTLIAIPTVATRLELVFGIKRCVGRAQAKCGLVGRARLPERQTSQSFRLLRPLR